MITLDVRSAGKLVRRETLAIGRHSIGSQGCEVVLAYPTVSRSHGCIEVDLDGVSYTDKSSRNGSRLSAQALATELPVAWPAGEKLGIGPFELEWRAASRGDQAARDELGPLAERYARWLADSPERARDLLAECLEGKDRGGALLERVHREFHGDGPLHEWLGDAGCREIIVNAFDEIFVDKGAGVARAEAAFLGRASYEAWAARTAHGAGRRLDLQNPICEATLANGARFHAVMPPVSARGLAVSIRRFGAAPLDERTALESGWLEPQALRLLREAVMSKKNIVISGGTSTGKTSLLNFLCRYLPPEERIVTVEDTVELSLPVRNVVQLQARSANADGIGQVTLRQLVQCALRLRPDRILVGECRGAEVLDMLQALNTGHPGSLTTVHANSTEEALSRLELLALLGAPNLTIECIREWIASSVEVVIQVARLQDGRRLVSRIAAKPASGGGPLEEVYRRAAD